LPDGHKKYAILLSMYVRENGIKPVIRWLNTGIFLVFFMVLVGAITRLTESGLSITEWKVVTGTIPPITQEDWHDEFEKYKQTPEYLEKNQFRFGEDQSEALANFKKIFFWEWLHRFLGRFIGVVFLVPFIWFWRKGYFKKRIYPRLLVIFLLGGFQGYLGWWMVKSGLVDQPHVSHYRLAAHLSTALATLCLIWWLVLDIKHPRNINLRNRFPLLKRIWQVSFIILIVQVIYGAFVAGKDAGQIFNTWPLMNGQVIGQGSFDEKPFYYNLIGEAVNLGGIQFIHRSIGILLYLMIAGLWIASRYQNLRHDARILVNGMFLMVNVQFLLGVLTLLYFVPVYLGVLHQAGAVILLMVSLYFYHQLRGTE